MSSSAAGSRGFFSFTRGFARFSKERRIPAQGRGSAADSIVAYVLDITKVDPIAHDLLFERFLTEDSRTMPDIDLDIATNDREEGIQYVYKKYGEHPASKPPNREAEHGWEAPRSVPDTLEELVGTMDEKERTRFPLFRELVLA